MPVGDRAWGCGAEELSWKHTRLRPLEKQSDGASLARGLDVPRGERKSAKFTGDAAPHLWVAFLKCGILFNKTLKDTAHMKIWNRVSMKPTGPLDGRLSAQGHSVRGGR